MSDLFFIMGLVDSPESPLGRGEPQGRGRGMIEVQEVGGKLWLKDVDAVVAGRVSGGDHARLGGWQGLWQSDRKVAMTMGKWEGLYVEGLQGRRRMQRYIKRRQGRL